MSNLAHFPRKSPRHEDDQAAPASQEPKELQRLLSDVVEALTPRSRPRADKEIRIRNFRSARLELVDDLIVVLEEYNDYYVANSYDTGQYGHGFSPDDAIYQLCSVLEDYYDLLLEDEGHLSPRLESHLRYLRSILKEREQ